MDNSVSHQKSQAITKDSKILSNNLSKSNNNWIGEKDGKILIRGAWSNRLQCNGCGDYCFVHTASDGKYYCGECRGKAVKEGLAIIW